MQPERKDTALIVVAVILGLVAIGAITLALMKRGGDAETAPEPVPAEESPAAAKPEETALPSNTPTVAPELPSTDPVSADVREPEPLGEDTQAEIQAIMNRVDRGELTLEEAQVEVNKLLGI